MADLARRTLLRGLGAFLCAPAIVRASSLMSVKSACMVPAIRWGDPVVYSDAETLAEFVAKWVIPVAQRQLAEYAFAPILPRGVDG